MTKFPVVVLLATLTAGSASAQSIPSQPRMVVPSPTSTGDGIHLTRLLANSERGQESLSRYHQLKREGGLPIAHKTASETVGSSLGFKVYNYTTGDYDEIEFTLSVQNERFNIWVETAELNNGRVTADRLEGLRVALEEQTPPDSYDPTKGVLELDELVFGNPSDVDGNGKTDVLVLDIRDGFDPNTGGASIQGFVDPNNLSSVNVRDILHLDTFPSLSDTANLNNLYLTAAHEYQHLIRFAYDPGELTFVDEGLSEWAEVMTGFGPRRNTYWSLASELRRPLLGWRGQLDAGVDYDYQRAGLFTNYISQRVGVPATGAITRSGGSGAAGYSSVLAGFGVDFKQLLVDFHVTNVVNDASVDPKYSHGKWFPQVKAAVAIDYDGTAATSATVTANGVGSNPAPLEPGSATNHRWTDVADFSIELDAMAGSGSVASMRQRLRAYLVARPASGAITVQALTLGGEGTMLTGAYREVTLVVAHIDASLPGGFNSSWAPFTYAATWTEGSIGTSTESTVYENGNVVVISENGGQTTLDAWPFSANTLGTQAQVANQFVVPDDGILTGVKIANFYASYFDSSIPENPRDYTLTIRPALSTGRPGNPVLTIVRTDLGPAPTIPGIGFDEVDLSGYRDELSGLSGTIFVAVTNAGTDQNTVVVPLAEWVGNPADNPSWFYLNFGNQGWSWSNFANITLNQEPRFEDRVAPIRATFTLDLSTAAETDPVLPASVQLEGNYPNPFNPQTTISFVLPGAAHARLAVYDVLGRQVAVLTDGVRPAGKHSLSFDGTGLPSGLYLYTLETGSDRLTRPMMLLK